MDVLYLGSSGGTSGQRARALVRCGANVHVIDPYDAIPKVSLVRKLGFKTGYLGLSHLVTDSIRRQTAGKRYDVCLVDNGELISAACINVIRKRCGKVALFNQDNPFVARDGARWRLFLKTLPSYDLYVTPRDSNVQPAYKLGAKQVLRVWFSADEEIHRPIALSLDDAKRFRSKVAFIGTWMPERGPFMATLLQRGVPLTIWGPRWEKSEEYALLRPAIADGELSPSDYVKAVAGADIALALLSEGNEDLHTTRSLEIPAIGSLLCGKDTKEHRALYENGKEAIFWQDAEDCAEQCSRISQSSELIKSIAQAGTHRQNASLHWNQPTLMRIIEELKPK